MASSSDSGREPGEVGERRRVPGAPACGGRNRLELAERARLDEHGAASVERGLRPGLGRGRAEREAAATTRHRERRGLACVAGASLDPERRSERRLVDEGDGRSRTTELDSAGNGRAEELPSGPELRPAHCGETRGELVVAVVLPRAELGLARRLPVADRIADGLREERRASGDTAKFTRAPRARHPCARRAMVRETRRAPLRRRE